MTDYESLDILVTHQNGSPKVIIYTNDQSREPEKQNTIPVHMEQFGDQEFLRLNQIYRFIYYLYHYLKSRLTVQFVQCIKFVH